eukprot:12385955-Ditylum_brightwellii.AAC.1
MEQLQDKDAVKQYEKSLQYTINQLKECIGKCEIHKKEDAPCRFCPTLISREIRTPETKDKALRAQVLGSMTRPIKDTSDPNHSLKPEAIRKHITDNGLAFEDLKKELPKLKS